MNKIIVCMFVLILILGLNTAIYADPNMPSKKRTMLELYTTAKEAYAKWQIAPQEVNILDVRTTAEYIFVGHAPMAVNIPVRFLKGGINPLTIRPSMPLNEDFVQQVKKRYQPDDTILVMCRSGARSAAAVNMLAKAGFKKAYNVVDGFEGDKLKVAGSYQDGKRIINGWKNSGAPWTYNLDRKLVYIP